MFGFVRREEKEALERELERMTALMGEKDRLLARMEKALEEREALVRKAEAAVYEEQQARMEAEDALEEYRHQHPPDEEEARRQAKMRKDWDELLGYTGKGVKHEAEA